jgi:NHLM bacteriocin system ABC transporter peptidase/ATP-binding protein
MDASLIDGASGGVDPRKFRRAVTTPTVFQMEAAECGAASLGIVLGYFRRFVSLDELRQACGVSRNGVRASNIVHAAREYGLEVKGMQLSSADCATLKLPFIAFWSGNHFLVVEGVAGNRIRINDPVTGRRSVSAEEFDERFSGVALEFEAGPGFKPGGHPTGLLRTLFAWTAGSKAALFVMAASTMLLALPTVLTPALVKVFVDEVLVRHFDTWLFPLLMSLVLAILLGAVITWLQQSVLMRLQMKLSIMIGARFLWHVLRLPLLFYTQRQNGDIVSRVQSANQLANLLAGPLPTAAAQSAMVVLYAAVMFAYSPPLTIVALLLSAGNVAVVVLLRRRLRDNSLALLNAGSKIAGTSMAGLQSIETIKAMGSESDFFRIWSGYQARSVNQFQDVGRASLWLSATPTFIASFMTAAVLGYGALLIIQGEFTIGGLVAFQMLMANFSEPLQQLISLNPQFQEAKGHLARLEDVFAAEIDPLLATPAAPAGPVPATVQLSGRIEVQDLSFAYAAFDPPVVRNVSFTVEPGQRIALVGGSGSGKSTLTRLLLGLYAPRSGTVLYDGRPIAEIPREVFTSSIAWVDQDIHLFEGTIHDNLTLYDRTMTAASIGQAIHDACIDDVVLMRPGSYGGRVTEGGTNFSGGQRQRLEIARALARSPSILVLDEATAALDPISEQQIDENIRRRGLTCIIVAQRLSTIRDADQIIVLDHGAIVEQGVHKELIARDGLYAKLVAAA